ncbi:MAG: metal-dependent hydrolase [Gammaproteobacteria bacterium]|nr:metal-dependent hydrolase [Gammaproteobacteria bacterium]
MDIVHHTLIGGAGYLIAAEHGQELAGAAFLLGSVFPDLDVVLMAFGKRFYLRNHQAISHSLPLSPLYALLLASPLLALVGMDWAILAGALLGLWLHVALDLTNTFRIALWSPFYDKRLSLDAVFFIDAIALCFTGLFYFAYLVLGWHPALYIYPAVFVIYIAAKFALQKHVKRKLECEFAIPSAFNPVDFFVLQRRPDSTLTFVYNALLGTRRDERDYAAPDQQAAELLRASTLYADMRRILRSLEVTQFQHLDDRIRIEAHDLAVRNFGGRFGRTRLEFDRSGKLLRESANI